MLWANTAAGKSTASPNAIGTCPSCGAGLIAKCGNIVSWHWAHKSRDCDLWSEPESEWHVNWKKQFPIAWQERTMGPHRADVGTANGVIEFQRSPISADEIQEREQFYGSMIWVVSADEWCLYKHVNWHIANYQKRNPIQSIFNLPEMRAYNARLDNYLKSAHAAQPHYQWSPPRKSWFAAQKTIYLDFGGPTLDRVTKIYKNGPFYLTCKRFSKETLIKQWIKRLTI